MATINTYLNFPGNTEEAFNFYKSVFGGEFSFIQHFKDTPEGANMSDEEKEKIMHIGLPIGKGGALMATDALESQGFTLVQGNNYNICISAETEEEAEKLFYGLSAGGKILVPLAKASWGSYFGMFNDKFGISWMINYDYN
ncbi:VOC family protein [Emticicia fontis]